MDINNVFIIVGRGWKREEVEKELIEEGYKHNFYFPYNKTVEEVEDIMKFSDEIWCFGDCVGYELHRYATKNNLDIWKMG